MSFIFIIIIFSLFLISSAKEENKYLIFFPYSFIISLLLIKYIIFSFIIKFPQIILVFMINSHSSLNNSFFGFSLSKIELSKK